MNHDFSIVGFGCKLRPVCREDAEFILEVRSQQRAKGNIHSTSMDIKTQEQWIENYFSIQGDYYWIVMDTKMERPVGTVGLYNYRAEKKCAEVGRWVMFPDFSFHLAAPILAVYEWAFEVLNLDNVIFDVVLTNRKVMKFHRLLGAREVERPKATVVVGNEAVDVQWFEVAKDMWPEIKKKWVSVLEVFE